MILEGDCRQTLKTLAAESVSSIVTDPPYEIGFMGKGWDGSGVANDPALWAECYRVLKPGGHVLAFGATRTYHRMACAIEDAGFEIRDSLHWVYGSGFPKSYNVSKGIDRKRDEDKERRDNAATDDARRWEGWGTALKPAHEPIVMARKPFPDTVAQNVLEHGTGALNIDASRIGHASEADKRQMIAIVEAIRESGGVQVNSWFDKSDLSGVNPVSELGRWPANVLLTHSTECDSECAPDCPAREIDRQSGQTKSTSQIMSLPAGHAFASTRFGGSTDRIEGTLSGHNDNGGASRYFAQPEWSPGDYLASVYTPKAGRRERNAGLDGMAYTPSPTMGKGIGANGKNPDYVHPPKQNHHPTVKPVALMRYLIRLVTPPGGLVLDPFLGSGTTAVAAILEGYHWVGCEITSEYLPIIEARCANAARDYPPINTIQNPDNSTESQLGLFEGQAL